MYYFDISAARNWQHLSMYVLASPVFKICIYQYNRSMITHLKAASKLIWTWENKKGSCLGLTKQVSDESLGRTFYSQGCLLSPLKETKLKKLSRDFLLLKWKINIEYYNIKLGIQLAYKAQFGRA